MMKHTLSRKERRKANQYKLASKQIKKGTTIISSAIMISSIAAPIVLTPKVAEATEGDSSSAEISNKTHSSVVIQDEVTADTTDSTTQTVTTESDATETTTSSEVDNSTESSTSSTISTSNNQESTGDSLESVPEADSVADTTLIGPVIDTYSLQPNSVNASAFIAEIAAFAQPVAAANDLYTSVMMAQAIIESGWGASTLSQAPNYNLFGIKGSYQGQSVYMDTWEYLNGQWVIKKEAFRKYPSYQQSFNDNAYVLKNTSFQAGVYYYSGTWKSRTNSYKDATAWLTGRYATDPSYGTKLNNIITTYNLTQYDALGDDGTTGGSNAEGENTGGGTTSNQGTLHTVKSGDSLWALANQYGTSVANIKSWNRLSSDTIYVGQKLIVGQSASTEGGNTGGSSEGSNTGGGSTSNQGTLHTVKSGDSLWALANQYGTSVANLKSWNKLSSETIYVGQKLIVSQSSTGGNTGGTTSGGSAGNAGGGNTDNSTDSTYTVKSGDSLWSIANANGVSITNLRQWNRISGDIIYPGQRLVVKKGGNSGGNTGGGSTSGNNGSSNTGGSTTTGTSYKVKSGDSLWSIANANGVSITNLRQWNKISGDLIFPGQQLIVKAGGSTSGPSNNLNMNDSSQAGKTHMVKSGDTLWDLARTYGISVQQIKQLNSLSNDLIYVGQKLKV